MMQYNIYKLLYHMLYSGASKLLVRRRCESNFSAVIQFFISAPCGITTDSILLKLLHPPSAECYLSGKVFSRHHSIFHFLSNRHYYRSYSAQPITRTFSSVLVISDKQFFRHCSMLHVGALRH